MLLPPGCAAHAGHTVWGAWHSMMPVLIHSFVLEPSCWGENLHALTVRPSICGHQFFLFSLLFGRRRRFPWDTHPICPIPTKEKVENTSWQAGDEQGAESHCCEGHKGQMWAPTFIKSSFVPLRRGCTLPDASALPNLACLGNKAPSDRLNLIWRTCEQFVILI